MHEIRTRIDISAPPARVWGVLTDFPPHAEWNPFIRSIEGVPQRGRTLSIRVRPEGGKEMAFRPRVLAAEPGRELRWRGHFLLPALFAGEHYFLLQPNAHGGTTVLHGEKFSGLLLPLMKKSLDAGTRAGFVLMNEALKARCEQA